MGCKNFFKKSRFHSVVDRMSKKLDRWSWWYGNESSKKEKIIRNSLKKGGQDKESHGLEVGHTFYQY